jgi:hypothetical protein
MQTLVDTYCKKGPSLRDAIAQDHRRLEAHKLVVVAVQKPGRYPGWLKLRSLNSAVRGAVNLTWHQGGLLRGRIVSKGSQPPGPIVGDFVGYLLTRHKRRVRTVVVVPE